MKRRSALRSTLRTRRKPYGTRALPVQFIPPMEDLAETPTATASCSQAQRLRIRAAHKARRRSRRSLRFGTALRHEMRASGRASTRRARKRKSGLRR